MRTHIIIGIMGLGRYSPVCGYIGFRALGLGSRLLRKFLQGAIHPKPEVLANVISIGHAKF